jgi:hypothetical protein
MMQHQVPIPNRAEIHIIDMICKYGTSAKLRYLDSLPGEYRINYREVVGDGTMLQYVLKHRKRMNFVDFQKDREIGCNAKRDDLIVYLIHNESVENLIDSLFLATADSDCHEYIPMIRDALTKFGRRPRIVNIRTWEHTLVSWISVTYGLAIMRPDAEHSVKVYASSIIRTFIKRRRDNRIMNTMLRAMKSKHEIAEELTFMPPIHSKGFQGGISYQHGREAWEAERGCTAGLRPHTTPFLAASTH